MKAPIATPLSHHGRIPTHCTTGQRSDSVLGRRWVLSDALAVLKFIESTRIRNWLNSEFMEAGLWKMPRRTRKEAAARADQIAIINAGKMTTRR